MGRNTSLITVYLKMPNRANNLVVMKNLMEFDSVKNALSQVVAMSDVDNGTNGMELLAYPYSKDTVYDKEDAANRVKMAKALLTGDLATAAETQKILEQPRTPKVIMIWRLMTPIKRLSGTKILIDSGKTFTLAMEDVKELHIPEDTIRLGVIQAEESGEMAENIYGQPVPILKLKIAKGLIDVAAPVLDRFDKEIMPKRAFVTAISYRSMQVAGEILSRERFAKKRRYGFDEQQ